MKRLAQIAGIILCLTILYGVVKAQTPSGAYNSPAQGSTSSGTVTSVSGTANQISVATGTTTPVISVPSTFIAPGSIASTTSLASGVNGAAAGSLILNGSTSGSQNCTNNSNGGTVTCNGTWAATSFNSSSTYGLSGKTYAAANTPTIATGGCGGSGATITNANGTLGFDVNVGTAPTSAGCAVSFANATSSWTCAVNDITTISSTVFVQKQTNYATNTATFKNFDTTATAQAPVASDIYHVGPCIAH